VELIWLLAAFWVPLAINPWGSNTFDLPKAALVLALTLLAGLLALWHVIWRPGPIRSIVAPSPLVWSALGFGVTLTMATVFSTDPALSFWGSYARQQGLLSQLGSLGLFAAVACALRTRAQAERLLNVLIWGSLPVVLYGLGQAMGLDPLRWQIDTALPVLATLGRPNFLASYLVLVIPVTFGRLLGAARRWQYALFLIAQLSCLALSGARGAWVGLAAAGLTFFAAWLVTANRASLALGILAAAAIITAVVAGVAIARGDEGSLSARRAIWRASLPLIAQRPWFGYGPETTRAAFATVYPPELVYYQGRGVMVDRAHNVWLDLGLMSGAAGVLAFGGLLVSSGWLLWRNLQAGDRAMRLTWMVLAAALIGHLIDMQAGVETVTSAALAWLLLGLVAALARGLLPDRSIQRQGVRGEDPCSAGALAPWYLCVHRECLPLVAPTLVVAGLMGLLCIRPLLADIAAWQALMTDQPEEVRLAAAECAVELWPVSAEYRRLLAGRHLAHGDLAAAEQQLTSAAALEPADAAAWTLQGDLLAHYGYLVPAEAAYRRAVALAPTIGLTHRALGIVLLGQGRLAEGIVALERAVDLDATDGVAFYHLAEAYEAQGDEGSAAWARRQALRWGF